MTHDRRAALAGRGDGREQSSSSASRKEIGRTADAEPGVVESGAWAETVKLGISARRSCVSSVVGIALSIREGISCDPDFQGSRQRVLPPFAGLERNNNREWFQPRKAIFEEMKQPMRELVSALNPAMKSFAPDYVTDPDKAIYRIYRDTRFNKDKTRTRTTSGLSHAAGTRQARPYYVAVSHKSVAIGGGI